MKFSILGKVCLIVSLAVSAYALITANYSYSKYGIIFLLIATILSFTESIIKYIKKH